DQRVDLAAAILEHRREGVAFRDGHAQVLDPKIDDLRAVLGARHDPVETKRRPVLARDLAGDGPMTAMGLGVEDRELFAGIVGQTAGRSLADQLLEYRHEAVELFGRHALAVAAEDETADRLGIEMGLEQLPERALAGVLVLVL